MSTQSVAPSSRFNAYFVRQEMSKLQFFGVRTSIIEAVCDLLERAPDDRVSVEETSKGLFFYPHGADSPQSSQDFFFYSHRADCLQSANEVLPPLIKGFNRTAEAAGRTIRMEVTSAERGEKCFLFFSGYETTTYLHNALPELDAETLWVIIRAVRNLEDPSHRPVALRYLAHYLPEIERDRADGKTIYGVSLYTKMAQRWLERDNGKHHIESRHKIPMAEHLAAYLWRKGENALQTDKLEDWLLVWLDSDQALKPRYQHISPEQLDEDLGTTTFLVREKRRVGGKMIGLFRFADSPPREFFLARYLLTALRENKPERWRMKTPSRQTLDFFGQLLAERPEESLDLLRTLHTWGQSRHEGMNELILDYTLRARKKGWPQPSLRGLKLNHADLADYRFAGHENALWDLGEIDFSHANLRRTWFHHIKLDGACFSQAALTQSLFWEGGAVGSRWHEAECSGAKWRRMDLHGSDWQGAMGQSPQFLFCQQPPKDGAAWRDPLLLPLARPHAASSSRIADNFTGSTTVVSCAFSTDGSRIVSGDQQGNLLVWDSQSGAKLLAMKAGRVTSSCAFSTDGARIVSGDYEGNLLVWDSQSGEQLLAIRVDANINSCAFSTDGSRIVSGDDKANLLVWDSQNGAKLLAMKAGGAIYSCAFSADGARIVSGGYEGNLLVWDSQSGAKLLAIRVDANINSCAFSTDGARIICGTEFYIGEGTLGTVTVWESESGENLLSIGVGETAFGCAFSADGSRIICGTDKYYWRGSLLVWDSESGENLLGIKADEEISSCAFSTDGSRIVSGDYEGNLLVWDSQSRTKLLAMKAGGEISSYAFSADGARIVSGDWRGNLLVWDSQNGAKLLAMKAGRVINSCAFSADGARIICGDRSGNLVVWDSRSGKQLLAIRAGEGISNCAFSADGARIVSGDWRGDLLIWDSRSGEQLLAIQAGKEIKSCAFSADGARIVSGGYEGNLLVWDSRSGKHLLAIKAGREIRSCAFSADGSRIVSGGYEGNLLVWDSRSGKQLLAIKAGGEISSCAFSADGARIVSGDQQGNLLVWDSQSGEKLLAMKADGGISSAALRRGNPYVISVDCAFSADGARIVSGDSRGNFLVWDSQSGERLWQLSYTGASHLCWQPPTGKILSASGLFWRDFYWDVTLADGGKECLPIEAFAGELFHL